MAHKILVIAAHADDEALGCGGTMARHVQNGDEVHVVILADGVTARDEDYDPNSAMVAIVEREDAACEAANILGVTSISFLRFPDNRCDSVAMLDIVKSIETHIADIQPHTIYTHHANDLNVDHRITHQAVLTACRPKPDHPVRAIYGFEVLSSTEWEPTGLGQTFTPNRFVDISEHIETKHKALAAYDLEMFAFPHPRSPEAVTAQNHLRGAQAGMMAAEAFMVIREFA